MRTLTAAAALASLMIPACATQSNQTSSAYVSPARFQTFECDRMGVELAKVDAHYRQASEEYRQYSQSFGLRLAASLVTFPLHQRLPSDGNERLQRLDRLKAEADVLRRIATEQGCSIPEPAQ